MCSTFMVAMPGPMGFRKVAFIRDRNRLFVGLDVWEMCACVWPLGEQEDAEPNVTVKVTDGCRSNKLAPLMEY